MSTPNWPIEIGAIYKETHTYLTLAGSRVTNIEVTATGNTIYYEDVSAKGYSHDFPTKRSCAADVFRALHHPQDLSPIAALYAHIERVTEWISELPRCGDDGEPILGAPTFIRDGLKLLEARKYLITEIE